MNAEQALEILPLVSTIIEKTQMIDYATKFKKVGQKEGIKIINHMVAHSKSCKEELFEVVATIKGKTIEEVKKQSVIELFNDLKEIFAEKDVLDFFKQAM